MRTAEPQRDALAVVQDKYAKAIAAAWAEYDRATTLMRIERDRRIAAAFAECKDLITAARAQFDRRHESWVS